MLSKELGSADQRSLHEADMKALSLSGPISNTMESDPRISRLPCLNQSIHSIPHQPLLV